MAFSFMDEGGVNNLSPALKIMFSLNLLCDKSNLFFFFFKCVFWHWLGYRAGC